MRLRASNHRASAAAKAFTVGVMAAAIFAQLLSISHEMTVRHFRCAEHGELTHVAAMVASAAELSTQRTSDAFRAGETQAADGHEHCGVAFTVEGSSCAPGGRAGVLASAPKTSPPSA
jgi:hypothetical protein